MIAMGNLNQVYIWKESITVSGFQSADYCNVMDNIISNYWNLK